MPRIDFTVEPSDGVSGNWIAVDEDDVPIENGKGYINKPSGSHFLVWWFTGNSGETLKIVGKVGSNTVVEVKKSTIPKDESNGAGAKRFTL